MCVYFTADPAFRPVLIVGPLVDCVTEKLIQDFPDVFTRCVPEVMHCSQAVMEKGMADNLFVDYRKKGSFFECTSISAIKDMMADKVSVFIIFFCIVVSYILAYWHINLQVI